MRDITKKLSAINATYLGQKTFLDTYRLLYTIYIDIMILMIGKWR